MASESAAMALRESFGDRKIPEISRKITACVACRKLKIKCHMNKNRPPCNRCRTRGLACTVNKSLQTLLEGDASWKEAMEERLVRLEQSVRNSCAQSQPPRHDSIPNISETPQTAALDLSCSLGAFPAFSMTSSILQDFSPRQGSDLVSRGLIAIDIAESLFAFYQQKLDSYACHIFVDGDSLATIRRRSSLLTTAICTASAFCSGSHHYRSLFDQLQHEVSGKLFSSSYEFDDVRALCIGTLWLPEISKALNGLAVRIATELDLHRCITKLPHTKRACYDRTRLYFLVYLCDHHCSLTHGKPPLTRDFHSLKSPRAFLESKFSSPSDMKLISQVELWSISSRVFDTFGADIDNCVDSQRLAEISRLEDAYEHWYGYWQGTIDFDDYIDHFSRRMFNLYFHSAKLYLLSHVFRGRSELSTEALRDVENYAHCALEHALSIVCLISCETRERLQQLPYYMGAVTAFASVCLVKSSSQKRDIICDKEGDDTITHLRRLVQVLHLSLAETRSNHPLLGIAESLKTVMSGVHQFDHDQHSIPDFNGLYGFNFAIDGLEIFNMVSNAASTAEATGEFSLFDTE